ncbi:hypothetical protein DRJ17_06785, partial [Candidatus Woesearchaeota archaeon]
MRRLALLFSFILFLGFSFGWWNTNYSYRYPVEIHLDKTLPAYTPIKLTINTQHLQEYGMMRSDCKDLVITDMDDNILPYYVLEKTYCQHDEFDFTCPLSNYQCGGKETWVWVGFPKDLDPGNYIIYIYFGNSNETTYRMQPRKISLAYHYFTSWDSNQEGWEANTSTYTAYYTKNFMASEINNSFFVFDFYIPQAWCQTGQYVKPISLIFSSPEGYTSVYPLEFTRREEGNYYVKVTEGLETYNALSETLQNVTGSFSSEKHVCSEWGYQTWHGRFCYATSDICYRPVPSQFYGVFTLTQTTVTYRDTITINNVFVSNVYSIRITNHRNSGFSFSFFL